MTYDDITTAGEMMTKPATAAQQRDAAFEPRIDDGPSTETEAPNTAPMAPNTAPTDLGAGAIARPTPSTAASPAIAALEACLSPLAALEAKSAATLVASGSRKPASRAPARRRGRIRAAPL